MSITKQMWLYAVVLPVCTFLGMNLCVWPFPRFLELVAQLLLWTTGLTVLVFLAAIPALVYFAVTSFFYRNKGEFLQRLLRSLACLCFMVLWVTAFGMAGYFRHQAFVRASLVGDQIVDAIAEYKNDNGEYPERIEQLLPSYLEKVPYTGMIAYPDFIYRKDFNDIQPKVGEYELRINCSSGGINFDRFIYWPTEIYPDRIQGNGVERIGKWAYVHE